MKDKPSSPNESSKRLKVLLFDSDGFSDYTSYLARGISKYVDVILYSFSEELPNVTGAAKQKGIKFIYIKKSLPKGYSSARGVLRVFILFFILLEALMRTNYDIVHIQDYLPALFLFIPILKLKRKRICWTLHDLDIIILWNSLFGRGMGGRLQILFRKLVVQPTLMSKYVDKIFVHALSHKQQLIAKKVEDNKIHVIRHFDYKYLLENNTVVSESESNHSAMERDYVLFFGNIAPWKGIDTLMEAANLVKKKIGNNFKLVIAGKPYVGLENVQSYKDIEKEGNSFVNILNRFISSSEIPSLIRNSSFLVLPYNNLFQYSASGVIPLSYTFAKPVIISNVPSLVEYVDPGKTGLIFDVNDSNQLANCMIDLIENNSKCLEMGQAAYQKMEREMSLDVCSKMINDIYNTIKYKI